MLTKEQIYGGTKYKWSTEKPLYTFYDLMSDFMDNELDDDIDVIVRYGNYCEVRIDYNRYGIKVYADYSDYDHVAEIELLED